MRTARHNLPDDPNEALGVKLRHLRALVDAAKADPTFRARALRVVGRAHERNQWGELRAVDAYVRGIRYQPDPVGVELFTDPRILAAQLDGGQPAAGDCDDSAGLAAALLEAVGIPARFRVGGDGIGWRHIWAEGLVGGEWVAMDTTVRRRELGWSPAPSFPALAAEPASGYHAGMLPINDHRSGLAGYDPRELAGFSLKKLVKKVTRPIEKAVSKATPQPIKKFVGTVAKPITKTVQAAWKVTGDAYGAAAKVVRQGNQFLAPIRPIVSNIVAPGSGLIVDELQRKWMQPQPPPISLPEPLRFMPTGGGSGVDTGAGYGGGVSASDFWAGGTQEQPKDRTVLYGALAVAGVAAIVLLTRRRR